MKLYIMRHGPAEDASPTGRDADRALTASGRDRVRDVAHELLKQDEAPHAILTSPLVRARQTADIVAAVTKLDHRGGEVEITRDIAPGGDGVSLVRALVREKRKRAMLVGHEPDLSELVYRLTGTHVEMLKALVVGLSATDEGTAHPAASPRGPHLARIRFVLDPKTLRWHEHDRGDA